PRLAGKAQDPARPAPTVVPALARVLMGRQVPGITEIGHGPIVPQPAVAGTGALTGRKGSARPHIHVRTGRWTALTPCLACSFRSTRPCVRPGGYGTRVRWAAGSAACNRGRRCRRLGRGVSG